VCAVDHAWADELHVGDILGLALEVDPLLDFGELMCNVGAAGVALAMDQDEDAFALLPTILGSEPTRRLRENHHSKKKEDGGNHLQTPWDTESSGAVDVGATVRDVEHDHDAPGDGPLLGTDETSTLRRWSDLGDVDWDLSGADTDTETVDDTSDNEHANVLGRADNDAADDPGYLSE